MAQGVYDHAQSPRLGQRTSVESTYVQAFSGSELPEAAWDGMLIFRNETQQLQRFNGNAWEDVVGGVQGTLTFVGPTPPTSQSIGDIWLNSADANRMYVAMSVGADQIIAGEWEVVSSQVPALTPTTHVYQQDTAPNSSSVPPPKDNDFWYETPDFHQYYFLSTAPGTHWISVQDQGIARSLNSVTTEYALGSSETVAPTTGWSAVAPTRTPGSFIWVRTTTITNDGSVVIGDAALMTGNTGSQGIPGPTGANGQATYTWIKYADTPTSGISDSPTGKVYMGIAYNKLTPTESSTYSDYEWSLIKGQDGAPGVPGPPGPDGLPTYTWIKYGTSSAGANLSDDPTGRSYIGIAYNKTTSIESTNPSDYEWSLILGPQGPQGDTGPQGSQGIQGPPGTNGQSLYTWLKYADTPTTGMSDSPAGKTYMGISYNHTSATESSVYSDYDWSLIQGPQGNTGIQGPPGANGAPTYTWIKYADNATGSVGFSDTPGTHTYIGIAYNKSTATESNLNTDYEWSLIQGPQGPQGNTGSTGPTGAPGADAPVIKLTSPAQTLAQPAAGGATTPATTTVTGTALNTTITVWDYSSDGAAFTTTPPAGVSRASNVVTITGGSMTARTIAVRAGNGTIADTYTIARVVDGATGATGSTGPAGSTGSTGPAGADAATVLLSNEAQSFAAGTTNALAGSTSSTVIAYKGSTAQTALVGTITGGATGITCAVRGGTNNTTAPILDITVTTSLTTANGTFTIPITVGGVIYTQVFAWSLAFTGAQGSTGSTGSTGPAGVGVSGTAVTYQVGSSGTTAPTGTWVSSPQATTTGQFLWTRTITTYTDSTTSTAYAVAGGPGPTGNTGSTGAPGVGVSGTAVTYQVGNSGTTAPTGTWNSTPSAAGVGQFAWTRTITTYTDTSTSTAYAVAGGTGATGSTGSQGPQGNPAPHIDLTATTQVLASPSGGGATTPATSIVSGTPYNTTITVYQYSVDGGAFSTTVPTGAVRTGNNVTITGGTMTARTIAVQMADANGIADTLTVAKSYDGATGATGSTGPTGNTGAPGTNGADGYTILLTNEANVFPGTTTAAVAGSAVSSVMAFKGATQIAATIGTITGQVTGLTTSIQNNGTNTAQFTVTVTTALVTQSGILTIPITADGKSFTQTFSWTVSYTGATGSTGSTGSPGTPGVSITSVVPYYAVVLQASGAPANPSGATPAAPWTSTEPAWQLGYKMYTSNQINKSDASITYSAVQLSSSYTAANNANNQIEAWKFTGTTDIDGGDIHTDTVAAASIKAGAITAAKLSVIMGGGNMWPNSCFSDSTAAVPPTFGTCTAVYDATTYYRGSVLGNQSVKITSVGASQPFGVGLNLVSGQDINTLLKPNTSYCVSAWVYIPSASTGITSVTSQVALGSTGVASTSTSVQATVKDRWVQTWQRLTTGASGNWGWTVNSNINPTDASVYYIGALQLEVGEYPSSWAAKPDEILPGTVQATMIQANAITATQMSSDYVYANRIDASQISGGTISSQVSVTSSLKTQDPDNPTSNQRVEVNSKGITLYDQNNLPEVQLNTDSAQPSTFNGTATLSQTTINGNLTVAGTSNAFSPGASVTMSGALGNPTTGPTVQVNWAPPLGTAITYNPDYIIHGLTWCKTKSAWFTANYFVGTQFLGFDNNVGGWTGLGGTWYNINASGVAERTGQHWFNPTGGVAWSNATGTDYFYVFGVTTRDSDNYQSYEIRRYTPNAGYTAITAMSYLNKGSVNGTYGSGMSASPCIFVNQAGAIGYAYYSTGGILRVAMIDANTLADTSNVSWPLTGATANPLGDGYDKAIAYAQVSNDFGLSSANRMYVCNSNSTKMFGYSGGSNVKDTTMDFPHCNNQKIAGAWYSNPTTSWGGPSSDAFYELDLDGNLYTHSNNMWTTESSVWYSGYALQTGATPTYTTGMGAATKFTMTKRAQVQLSLAKLPGSGGPTDPDRLAFYLGRGTTQPANTGFYQNPAAAPVAGALQVIVGPPGSAAAFSGNNPPATNTYPAAAVSQFTDTNGNKLFDSTGYGIWAPPGTVVMFATTTAPAGWLMCDGTNYSATDPRYAKLYAAIGTTFGGTTNVNFNVPNMQGRYPWGYYPGDPASRAGNIGAVENSNGAPALAPGPGDVGRQTHQHTHGAGAFSPTTGTGSAHTHNIPGQTAGASTANGTAGGSVPTFANWSGHAHGGDTGTSGSSHTHTITGQSDTGGVGTSLTSAQAYHAHLVLNFIIKL